MKGQWIGKTEGDVHGNLILNIDDLGDRYRGLVSVLPTDERLPSSMGYFETSDKKSFTSFKVHILPVDPITGLTTTWAKVQNFYPGINYSDEATVDVQFEEYKIHFIAKTNLGLTLKSDIFKKPFSADSDIPGEVKSWEEYKSSVSTLTGKNNLFRGQRLPWKLRTTFHRKGRYDLSRFQSDDVPLLYRRLSARTSHVFNLEIPNEYGAFLSLVQHHGYPTPLLDWTYSPYVAAFFAFRDVPKNNKKEEVIRVFIFNQEQWKNHWRQIVLLNIADLHLSVLDFLAIDNDRLVPQQAATTVTNIDDIELYIMGKEDETGVSYLTAIDIPTSERDAVMRELSFMGITAGSMFPGLDGTCEELKENMFNE